MRQHTRNAAMTAVLLFLCVEVAAVHLLLAPPLAAALAADAAVILTAAAALRALLAVRRLPAEDPRFSEHRCQGRALRHGTDHERRAREFGRPGGL
ncbi:hypothetical protein [Streptomyces yaizuensis]|uniref:Secreted protein n=1 Tax=Streptomyces yaizuensis TaxID=2989713 RepID=A0ABQ5NRN5_9ACTN|nr:hypothetical protein [Streptomyces sp. YSPA8]GLF92706.1 hypothetical protein SYYSPA8_00435 [Streptomyces sp. YSPA8]